MPVDYSSYPSNWKTEIRPDILLRAEDCCEQCKVKNKQYVCRGKWWNDKSGNEIDVYQDEDGYIFSAINGEKIGQSYVGDVFTNEKQKGTKIVLTIAHLDHDTTNNEYSNLKALCQKCHLSLDKELHMANRKETNRKKKKQTLIEFPVTTLY